MTGWAVPGFVPLRQVRVDAVGRRVIARHRVNRKVVSITYLSPEFLADAEFRNRFVIESERLGQVRDAAVARVYQYVECGDSAAVVADHIEGTPLRTVLLDEGAISVDAAVVMFKEALRGVAASHDAGLVHGDLKPEDVLLTRSGRVRLVDFGLSTCSGRQLLARSTPFYLAPEQWSGAPATEPADLYAATVTFFECLAGAPPFHADTAASLATLHERSAPPLEAVPGPVRELVRSGLAKDPAARPSARSLLGQVEDVAARSLGAGWERRGRRELSRLLTRPSHPADVPVVAAAGRRGRERHVRLGAVLGGALVLAAGLSSPPFPAVLLPGPSGVSDPHDRPPVQAFPAPAEQAGGAWAEGRDPGANRPPDPQSAVMSAPAPTAGTPPAALLPSAGTAQPRVRPAAPGSAPLREGLPGRESPGSVTPRSTPPVTEGPAPAPAQPPAPSEQDPQPPQGPVEEPSGPAEEPSGSSGDPSAPSDHDPSDPAEQHPVPMDSQPDEPSGRSQGQQPPRVVQAGLPGPDSAPEHQTYSAGGAQDAGGAEDAGDAGDAGDAEDEEAAEAAPGAPDDDATDRTRCDAADGRGDDASR